MFLEEGVEHWETVNRINYLGVVYTLKAVVPGMVQRNSGRIIVTNSSGSFMGAPHSNLHAMPPDSGLGRRQCAWISISVTTDMHSLIWCAKLSGSGDLLLNAETCMHTGAAGISAYCASKHAVRGFMDSLRLEVRADVLYKAHSQHIERDCGVSRMQ